MTDEQSIFEDSQRAIDNASCLYTAEEVDTTIQTMAQAIINELQHLNPIVLPVMIGGVVLAGKLIPQLPFAMQIDYVHATRYQSGTAGQTLNWIKKPTKSLQDKTVLLIDDILDEGITLAAIIDYCYEVGANKVYTAVLAEKQLNKPKPLEKADFTGLTLPNRYVFGVGMDYREYHRNLAGIYALNE